MKKIFTALVIGFLATSSFAQNVQVHYDFGESRKMVTTTVEMFKPDKIGSTFFFFDLDYGSDESQVDGINLAYMEFARSFKWNPDQKLEPRIEYNGGFGRFNELEGEEIAPKHYSINSSYLAGVQYTWNNPDFSKVFTLQANYKYIKDVEDASFQITGVWGLHFFNRKVTFMGFADFWKEKHFVMNDSEEWSEEEYVFLTEPQLWYNVLNKFSVGTEIEISNNFGTNYGFMINPTLAAKWTF